VAEEGEVLMAQIVVLLGVLERVNFSSGGGIASRFV
jgi:hypothetical protein